MGAVHVARTQGATLQIAELVEHEQRVIARAAEVTVVGRALLVTVGRADGAVMSSTIIFGGLRSLTWSIQMPKRSASAARLSLVASNSVSNRPIWLVDAPPRSTALPPTIPRIAGSRPSRSASFTSSYPARRP